MAAGGGARQALVALLVLVSVLAISSTISAVNSYPHSLFNATPDAIYLNWTNGYRANLTLTACNLAQCDNQSLIILNTTTYITGNYSQKTPFDNDTYGSQYNKYWWSDGPGCFHPGIAARDSPLASYNGTTYNATNKTYQNNIYNMSNGTVAIFTLVSEVLCPPGRYWGNLTVQNTTSAEILNVTVYIDVPISTSNELNQYTGLGYFKGIMQANYPEYHYYYFNASNITNATALSIDLDWSNPAKDMDVFLFDGSGNLVAKSINNYTNYERLNLTRVVPNTVYEIRVYGNTSTSETYTGTLRFSTMNINRTDTGTTLSVMDFGSMNVTGNETYNITLINEGNITHTPVQSVEIYHIGRADGSSISNYTFIVSAYASRVRASANWTGTSNYSIYLYNPDGCLMGYSRSKKAIANVTGAEHEEFVETSNVSEGIWRADVINYADASAGTYTIMAKSWIDSSGWLSSNYTSVTINTTGQGNCTQDIRLNMSPPTTAISGEYNGYLKYTGSMVQVPFKVNVTSPSLMVNNTFSSGSISLIDNVGANRSGNTVHSDLTINNTGNLDLTLGAGLDSSEMLTDGSGHNISFNFSHTSSIAGSSSGQLSIDFTINTDQTANTAGMYRGWIWLNASDAYPYQSFNLSINFNLTDELIVNGSVFVPTGWHSNYNYTNQSFNVNAYFQNRTEIKGNQTDFSVWLVENSTGHRIPSGSSYLASNKYAGAGNFYSDPSYILNATLEPNQVGGWYTAFIQASDDFNGTTPTLSGTGQVFPIIINGTGLNMTRVSSLNLGSQYEGMNSVNFTMVVTNYGPSDANGDIYMSDCSYATVEAKYRGGNCADGQGGRYFNITLSGNGTETCWYEWEITPADSVDEDKTCTLSISSTDPSFNNITGITFVVSNNATTSEEEEESSSGNGGGGGGCTSDSQCAASYYCDTSTGDCTALSCTSSQYISDHQCVDYLYTVSITEYTEKLSVLLGSSNTTKVKIKNTGDDALTAKLNISIDSGITYSVEPAGYGLIPDASHDFTVTFSALNTTTIGDHEGSFRAWTSKDTSTYYAKSFILTVLPTAEREEEISSNYSTSAMNYTAALEKFSRMKASGLVSEENITRTELLLNESKDISDQIKAALDSGDYATAESLLGSLESLLNRVNSEMSTLAEEEEIGAVMFQSALWMYGVAAVVIIGIAAFIVYMLMPPKKGYKPGYGFKPKTKGSVLNKAREAIDKVKKKKGQASGSSSSGKYKYKYKK